MMKLLTKEIIKKMPHPGEIKDAKTAPIIVKFFGGGSYTLYVIAASAFIKDGGEVKLADMEGKDVIDIQLFGYVTGLQCDEWGYASFNELKELKFPPFGLGIERDMYFGNCTVAEILNG